ncbi:hypothetical protein J19TS2_13770 [Cohnella xylanilytica]|uniref:stalk domain-containing protein n=1 Tax=Cohnella xylanilytica TaxID=557555 RepID=UPI001B2D7369|nr:stalk domain-containing protein [Cohnella xylanilytica]GIO11822.1 hypothetical protein J19TS2_13770 [Cohnella xylanilytica]
MNKRRLALAVFASLSLASISPAAALAAESLFLPSVADHGGIAGYGANSLVKSDGTYWTWGDGRSAPTQIAGLADVETVLEGNLVVKKDGSVWHWEKTDSADGAKVEKVEGLTRPVAVRYTYYGTLAVDAEGNVFRAEMKDRGPDMTRFAPVTGIGDVADLTYYYDGRNRDGQAQWVFLKRDGTVWKNADYAFDRFVPIPSAGPASSVQSQLVLKKDGTVLAWPIDNTGTAPSWNGDAAVRVPGLSGIRSVWTNTNTNLAIDAEGKLWFWGATITGWTDSTVLHNRTTPVQLKGLPRVKTAYAVERSLVALSEDGKLYATSIERSDMPAAPEFKLLSADVGSVLASKRHLIYQKTDGTLWGWGVNKAGQLGYGDLEFEHLTPVPVQPPVAVTVNGETARLSNGVIVRSGQTFVPLRSVFEKLGAKISWDENGKVAAVERQSGAEGSASGDTIILVDFKSSSITLNGKPVKLANDPFGIGGVSYLPLRFVSESLGAKVDWKKEENRIDIEMK